MDFFTTAVNAYNITPGLWDAYRSEGRFTVNIADGLSELGHNCHIQSPYARHHLQIKDNLSFVKQSAIEYDYCLGFSEYQFMSRVDAKNYLLMYYQHDHMQLYMDFYNQFASKSKTTFVDPYLPTFKVSNQVNNRFLPTVFPLPSYSKSFLPFNYDLKNNKIIIYGHAYVFCAQITDWFSSLLFTFCNYFAENGLDVELRLQTNHEDFFNKDRNLLNDKVNLVYVSKICDYNELYKRINDCDVGFVVSDFGSAASAVFDFISLGKPIFYTVENSPIGYNFVNPLLNRPDKTFISHGMEFTKEDLYKYLDKWTNDPEGVYNAFKETIWYYDFNNWKDIVMDVLQ